MRLKNLCLHLHLLLNNKLIMAVKSGESMDFMKLVKTRHSVRDFLPDPIPEEVLSDMLEAARLAPSTQNRQPWRYFVFTDPAKIRELARNTGLIGLSNYFVKDAPCIIIACADASKDIRINGQDYYLVDLAISFHQLILCASSHGIGCCWMAAFSEKRLAKYLKLPKNWRIVAFSPFGYPKGEKGLYTGLLSKFSSSHTRLSMDEIVIRNP